MIPLVVKLVGEGTGEAPLYRMLAELCNAIRYVAPSGITKFNPLNTLTNPLTVTGICAEVAIAVQVGDATVTAPVREDDVYHNV